MSGLPPGWGNCGQRAWRRRISLRAITAWGMSFQGRHYEKLIIKLIVAAKANHWGTYRLDWYGIPLHRVDCDLPFRHEIHIE